MAARRNGLARRRAAMGFTQETLAEHLGVERSTVARWERGTMTPQPWNRPVLAKALKVSHDTLADFLSQDSADQCAPTSRTDTFDFADSVIAELGWRDWLRSGQPSVLEPAWSIAGTMQVLHQIAGGPMDRRGFL